MRLGKNHRMGSSAPRLLRLAPRPRRRQGRLEVRSRPGKASEVEISFISEGPAATRVNLEHRCLERHGEGYQKLVALFDGPDAWMGILEHFAKTFEKNDGATA
jgi:hypothetical protein